MNRAILVGLVGFALLAGACTPVEERPADLAAPAEPLLWPEPPAPARIEFLYGFREPRNLGIQPALFDRAWAVIAGEEIRQMVRPYAIAVEGSKIAVTDPGLAAVHLFDPDANTYRRIIQAGEIPLRSPVGVAFGAGLVFVADSVLERVFAFDPAGELALTIEGVGRPTGLAYDGEGGRLYVADTLGHRVAVFDGAGAPLFSFGERGTGPSTFNYPTHLALRGGRLYVNDTMNFRVQTFDLEGNHIATFGRHGDGSGDLAQPKGIGVDQEGHIYLADALFDRVQIFAPDGAYLLNFGGAGNAAGEFWLPTGLFISADRIYVADSYNRRVQVFRFLGGG